MTVQVRSKWSVPASGSTLSRRHLLSAATASAAAAPLLSLSQLNTAFAAPTDDPLNRFPRMVQQFFVRQVRQSAQRHLDLLDQVKTRADAQRYVKFAQQRVRASFGDRPARTPLKPRITGTIDRDAYRIEKLIFESRPGFPVTANLYLPNRSDGSVPGVVGTCGHSSNGKAALPYQSFAQGLARLGQACLIFDPIGQGERLQYPQPDGSSAVGVGVREHLYAGNQQFLVGDFFGMWRAWDGIRALDYLRTRDEVDPERISVTGNSGGGTMTTWLCGLDQRWSSAAPSCFVTTFRRNLENELPQDTEQCPPRSLALNLDHADFLAAMAPKPVIILAKERDFFDVRGAEETYSRLRRLYQLLDAEENIALFVGPTDHGYSEENREAMYSWFRHVDGLTDQPQDGQFGGVLESAADVRFTEEPDITIEEDETLWCTPDGQVADLDGTRSVFDFTREKSLQLSSDREKRSGDLLRNTVTDVLRLPASWKGAPPYRIYRHLRSRGYPSPNAVAYTVRVEPEIHAIVYRLTEERWHARPPRAGTRAILYVSHLSSDVELREEPLIRDLMEAEPGVPVYTCDVRGIGESLPNTCDPNSFHDPYGSDYFYAIHSIMLDRPYVGQKTLDVLRVLEWLASLGHSDVHLAGLGWGALPATFAALLSEQVKQVTLKNALTSYADVAEARRYDWPLSTLLPNVLLHFDLPDCYAELQAKALQQIDPWNANAENA